VGKLIQEKGRNKEGPDFIKEATFWTLPGQGQGLKGKSNEQNHSQAETDASRQSDGYKRSDITLQTTRSRKRTTTQKAIETSMIQA